jgi:acyl-CoA thioesterase-1
MRSSSIMHAPDDGDADCGRDGGAVRAWSRRYRVRSRRYGAARPAFNARAVAVAVLLWLLPALAWGQENDGTGDDLRILAYGASIVAGFGLDADRGLAASLECALRDRGYDVEIVNAGVSGDTSAGGLARLDWTLGEHFDIAILALGANDGLRGLDPADTRANLDALLTRFDSAGIPVLFVGMYAPRNLGADYVAEFDALYPALAEAHHVAAFMPFLLEGVALDPALNQPDGIHPNEKGVAIMVEHMVPYLLPLIDAARADTGG